MGRKPGAQIEEMKLLLSWGHPSFWGPVHGTCYHSRPCATSCLTMLMTRRGRLAFLGSHLLKQSAGEPWLVVSASGSIGELMGGVDRMAAMRLNSCLEVGAPDCHGWVFTLALHL